MREVFHHQLNTLRAQLVEMGQMATTALATATQALLEADLARAEQVIAADAHLDNLQLVLDDAAVNLLAQQQPVATDLRIVVSALRMSMTLERMGDLSVHIAKLARLRYPDRTVPPPLEDAVREMSDRAQALGTKAARMIAEDDLMLAAQIASDDNQLDELHKAMFDKVAKEELPHHTVVDLTLLSRYIERFGDHTRSLAKREEYLVNGLVETIPTI